MKSLLLHPLRSLLTATSVIFGVFSVILLLAIAKGISEEAERQIQGLGADNIIIRSTKPVNVKSSDSGTFILPYGLTREDYSLLVETIPNIRSGVRIRETKYVFRSGDKTIKQGRLVGCEAEYADITQLEVDHTYPGSRFIEDADVMRANNVCVIAGKVAERLFPYGNPIGASIYLEDNADYYEIVGVLKHREATAAIGGSLDSQDFSNDVYIPITAWWKRMGDVRIMRGTGTREGEMVQISQITLRIDNIENVRPTARLVEETLMPESDKGNPTSHAYMEDVSIVVPKELLDQAERTKRMYMALMVVIAGISLLVGGIGIMNIMLATVTERTREIGIRRALGARRSDIIRQFMVETVALTVVGGAVGVLFGFLAPELIMKGRDLLAHFRPDLYADLPLELQRVRPSIVPISIPLAFATAVITGLVFGIYPAMRAAKMDPIEALRHE